MTRMIHPVDLGNIRSIARLIGNGKAPWQQSSKNPTLPYNINEHKFFDTYQTLIMLTTEAENGYKRSCWINSNDLKDSVYQVKPAERPLSLSEPIYLQTKRDLNGNEVNEVGFAAYPDIGMQNYYNVEQCNISIFNRIMNSGEMSASELKKKQKATLDAVLKSDPSALEKLSEKDFHNIDSSLLTYDDRYIQGHYSKLYDSRYRDIDYYTSQYLHVLVNEMIEYRLCAELGLPYNPEDPHRIQIGPDESDSALIYDGNLSSVIESYPEVFISLCEDVDTAVNHFLGRDRIPELEQSLDKQIHLDTHRLDFKEDDILVFPKNENTLSWETISKSLRSDIRYNDSFVVIDYQGKNIGLADTYSSINEADAFLKKIDEKFAFLDERAAIKFTAYFSQNGRILSYTGRYDIGNNDGGLVQHIKRYCNEHLNSSKYHDFIKEREGIEGLKLMLDALSEFRSITSTLIDFNYNHKMLFELQSNDNEIINLQEENRQAEYLDNLMEQDELSMIRKSLLLSYDYLSLDYRERISREDLRNDTCPGLTLNIAIDALNGAYARMKLKNYLPVNDIRWSTMSTIEAEELAESYKGKMNLQQQAYFEKNKIHFDANTTYADAKKIIEEGKATEKMLTYASTFFPRESLTNLSREELNEATKAYVNLGYNRRNETVSQSLYNLAVEYGLVKKGENYTYGQWAKDALECKPFEPSKAYIERHKLQDVVASLIQKYPNMWPKESEALYSHVRSMNDKRISECKASPINDFQKAFLNNRGISTEGIKTWQEAQISVCDSLFKEGIISLSDVKIVAYDTTITLPEHLANEKAPKLRSSEEKAALVKEVKELCNDVRRAERLYKIKVSTLETNNSIMNISRKACYDHLVNTGSLVNAEKSMAVAIVCSDFKFNSFSKDSTPLVKSINGTDKSSITDSQVIAHYITKTLPDCVGKYQESMPKILKVVQAAEMSLEKVKVKEAIKEEARTQALANKNEKNKGTEI